MDNIIKHLTAQLRKVNIRLAQLEVAASCEDPGSSAVTAAAPTGRSSPTSGSSTATATAPTECSFPTAAAPILKKGDRANITNTVSKLRSWNNNFELEQEKAQKATVTHFYKGQVHFVTEDNGMRTW
jgi:hypothetical protein